LTYDSLARLASANCGSIWGQTFSFDAFGNISKTGTNGGISFQPTYASTNRYSTLPAATPTYDANGNLLNDGFHTYTWDADGNAVTVDSIGLTYDALDRMVEQNSGGSYTQFVYGPDGGKLALMNGQTLSRARVPLPGGGRAVYTSGPTLLRYWRPDWQGSVRLATNPDRTIYADGAFAPYGEQYASSGMIGDFTGQVSDTVWDMYNFPFREYQYIQGRWISPDPAGLGAVDPANPQTWNRYAYVTNNPLALIDPLGLDPDPESCDDIQYAITHAECGSSPVCDYFMLPCSDFPPGGGGGGETGGGGGWSENPGINISQPPSPGDLLGFPQPQIGCGFGSCGGPIINSYSNPAVPAPYGAPYDFVIHVYVSEPQSALDALLLAGRMAGPTVKDLAALTAVAPARTVAEPVIDATALWAITHPTEWVWMMRFAGGVLGTGQANNLANVYGRMVTKGWNWFWNQF